MVIDRRTNGATKRVKLEHDRWVDVRRLTVGDISASHRSAHERGWDDDEIDAIGLLPRVIIACSDGEVTQEFADSLTVTDFANVWATVKGADIPNPFSPSSGGSSRRRGVQIKGRMNGLSHRYARRSTVRPTWRCDRMPRCASRSW